MNSSIEGTPSRRPGRTHAAAAVLAVAAIVGAGAAIWASIGEDVARVMAAAPAQQAAPPPRAPANGPIAPGRPIAEDELAYWSDVAIYRAGPGRPRPVVVVRRGRQPLTVQAGVHQGLLAREVVRQGLLLSAREELGAVTRDVPIGDPEAPGTPDATFRIGSRFRTASGATPEDPAVGRITIIQGDGAGRRVLWSGEFPCDANVLAPDYPRVVAEVERFSRGGFRTTLEALGLKPPGPAIKGPAEGPLPEGIEARLGRPVEAEQFAAIRALHAAIRARGENSSLLIGLARAYATLGSLSESQWTADHQAFKARALLYAQRAVVRDHDAAASLRGQAYAEALAGLFRQSLADFAMADKADGGKEVPPWAAMARAYAHSDASAAAKLAEARPDDPMPPYFRFLTLLQSSAYFSGRDRVCRGELIAAARALLAKVPDCYRVHDGMVQAGGVSNLHWATTIGFELFPRATAGRVAAVPGLPASVARLADDGRDEVGLRKGLVVAAADDPEEPTWGVLARQLREIRFLQVCRRIHFQIHGLGTDAVDFAADAMPLVGDHPNRAYVETYLDRFAGRETLQKLAGLDLADVERKMSDLIHRLKAFDPGLEDKVSHMAWAHECQGTVPGQVAWVKGVDDKSRRAQANNLLKFDPESPLGRAAMIESGWERAWSDAASWEKDHGGDTVVIAQLGLQSLKAGQLDVAQRRLEAALARSPDRWIFDGLAEVYKRRGQVDRWVEAVGEYLKTEDQSLDHAHVTGDLAEYLMSRGDYDRARPFAELSAGSGAGWAMNRAARCAERMGDWEAAETWVSRTAQRYGGSWLDWFGWCKRTGRGDVEAAIALIENQLAAGRPIPPGDEGFKVAMAFLTGVRPREAREILGRRFREGHQTQDGEYLALACDLAGDVPARDATLKEVGDQPNPSSPKTARMIQVLSDWLSGGGKGAPDVARIDAILGEVEPLTRPNSCAIVGLLLDRIGRPDEALNYLKQADSASCAAWFRYPVRDALRARKVELAPFPW